MKLNPDNDIYQGDLTTLNRYKQAWSSAEESSARYRTAAWVVVAVGFLCIIYVYTRVRGGTTTMSQLPLHIAIWVTALLAIFVSKRGKKVSEQPFAGFHMAHFEADDDTVYYQFQKGMSLRTYYIKDKDIKKIYRDDPAGVLLIEGPAKLNIQTRKNETEDRADKADEDRKKTGKSSAGKPDKSGSSKRSPAAGRKRPARKKS